MKTANEMFKELGYELEKIPFRWTLKERLYIDRFSKREGSNLIMIDFNSYYKTIEKTRGYDNTAFVDVEHITLREFKAIHKYLEEKGWLDE